MDSIRLSGVLPQVSVVIVNWNTRDLLVACLRSLAALAGGVHCQIIVVDNASSDDSVETVQRCFPEVRVIQNTRNLGFAKANNIGLAACSGDYICLVNSDIEVLEGCLPRLVAFMQAHPEVGMLAPRLLNPDRSPQATCWKFPTLQTTLGETFFLHRWLPESSAFHRGQMTKITAETPQEIEVAAGAFWMVRRRALELVGGLDEAFFFYGEDIDWCRRFHQQGWKVMLLPQAEAVHFGGASSEKAPLRFAVERCRARCLYFQKHHSTPALWLMRGLLGLSNLIRFVGAGTAWLFSSTRRPFFKAKLRHGLCVAVWAWTGRDLSTP